MRSRRMLVGLCCAVGITITPGLPDNSAFAHPNGRRSANSEIPLSRPADPVIIPGSAVPSLVGAAPDSVVAYRYSSTWVQIPVQVDERDVVDFGRIYNVAPLGVSALVYTDPATWTGPDTDQTVDGNDEIVFMARDAGGRVPADVLTEPAGTMAGSGLEIRITDALDPAAAGYVYLFRTPGPATQPAPYIAYSFRLLSGSYRGTYDLVNGPNPEDSTAVTMFYRHHFSDRWIVDETKLGDSPTAPDLLDRDKVLFAPGLCDRSENTFCGYDLPGGAASRGAFIANKSGPVRAIRSYVGANSGVITERDHFLYERREDVVTTLRVHPIPGCMSFLDFSASAAGMTYSVKERSGSIQSAVVDGRTDGISQGDPEWEMVSGPQGTIVKAWELATDITGLDVSSYYLDDVAPSTVQCTGDSAAYGASGIWIRPGANSSIPCTDPLRMNNQESCPTLSHLALTLHIAYERPGIPVGNGDAQRRSDEETTALGSSARRWPNGDSGTISDSPGVYDGATGTWFLRNTNSPGNADVIFGYGAGSAGLVPIDGDWDGNGADTPGVFDPATSVFFLRNSNSGGPGDLVFQFGAGGQGAVPVAGDWNGDGIDTVGVYVPATGTFFLTNANASGSADVVFTFGPGGAGVEPLTGDWNGDGIDTVGLFDSSSATFFLTDTNAPGPANNAFSYGAPGSSPVTGDWNGDGSDSIGVYQPATGAWFLRNQATPGSADLVFTFGAPGLVAITGNWDGP